MPFALSDIRTRLFASVLSDCLDAAGVMDHALPARIRPLDEASVMVGRARTAQFMEVDHHETGTNPYEQDDSGQPARALLQVWPVKNPTIWWPPVAMALIVNRLRGS